MSDAELTVLGLVAVGAFVLACVMSFLMLAGMWKMFGKAGRKGWLAFVPLCNSWVLYELAGKPGWWSLIGLVPVAGWIVLIFMSLELVSKFGKGTRFAVLAILIPPVAYAILGFGKAKYANPEKA